MSKKRHRCVQFTVETGPETSRYFDVDGNQIAGPTEPVRLNVNQGKVSIGPVPLNLAREVTGLRQPTYFEILKQTSRLTGASVDKLDELPDDELIEFVRGAIEVNDVERIRAAENTRDCPIDPTMERAIELSNEKRTWPAIYDELNEDSYLSLDAFKKRVKRYAEAKGKQLVKKPRGRPRGN